MQLCTCRITYVYLFIFLHICPLRLAVEPYNGLMAGGMKLITLHSNSAVALTKLFAIQSVCCGDASLAVQLCRSLVEHTLGANGVRRGTQHNHKYNKYGANSANVTHMA